VQQPDWLATSTLRSDLGCDGAPNTCWTRRFFSTFIIYSRRRPSCRPIAPQLEGGSFPSPLIWRREKMATYLWCALWLVTVYLHISHIVILTWVLLATWIPGANPTTFEFTTTAPAL
jgi:hypothetical protein